jgi:hypothetical protein
MGGVGYCRAVAGRADHLAVELSNRRVSAHLKNSYSRVIPKRFRSVSATRIFRLNM